MTDPSTTTDLHDGPEPLSAPNPLGTGNIKLTMPTRRRRPQEDGDANPEPAHDEPAPPVDGEAISDTADAPEADDDLVSSDNDSSPKGYGLDPHVVMVFGGLAAVIVVVAALVWWFSQPTPQPKPTHTIAPLPTAGPAETTTVAPIAEDGPLAVVTSAVCPGQTDPKLATSTDKRSAWVCPTGGVPFGQKLTATVPQPSVITGIKFWPNFEGAGPDGRDEWFRHRVLQELQCVFNDRDLTTVTATPNGERHEYSLAVHVVASQVDCTVTATVPAPPQPATTPTSAPPGVDPASPDATPEIASMFPAKPADPADSPDGTNDPNGSSVAVNGFQLIGHAIK